jgi:predicted cobalt transporter CbtA
MARDARTARTMAGYMADEPELVSRAMQKGLGLLTAALLYGAAIGGIFSLVFAYCYGRLAMTGPRTLALLLSLLAFALIVIVPAIKYPPNPPAVGLHETVGLRTAAYFAMIGMSVVACIVANRVRILCVSRIGQFNAFLAGGAAFIGIVALVQLGLPSINEVPADFSATILWQFRVASLGMQLVLWLTLGLTFGVFVERLFRKNMRVT